jgi:hypothetical protein
MDLSYLVNQIKGDITAPNLRVRQGKVITVNSNRTIDVQIAGDTNTLPSVRYLSNYAPKPDDQTWLLNSGADLLAIGMVAGATRTLTPKAYRGTAQSITANTETLVSFSAVENDDWNCWDASPNPTRLTAPITGRYIAVAMVKWSESGNDADWFSNSILVNGTQEIAYGNTKKLRSHGQHINVTSPPITLTKNDYIELLAESSVDAQLIVTANGDSYVGWMPSLSLIYLGS